MYIYNQPNNSKKKHAFISIFLSIINVIIIVLTDLDVLISYFYTILLFYIISFLLGIKKKMLLNFSVLSIYTTLALFLYLAQLAIIPDSYGFTGPYSGIGTDDSRFYAAVASNNKFIPVYAMRFMEMNHNFVKFLKVLYPFYIKHPLSIIIPNLIGISFIPYFTKKTAEILGFDKKYSRIVFIMTLFCPLILSNGLILMRDGWTAFLTILGFCFLIKKEFYGYLFSLGLLLYIRMGSGLILAFMPVFYLSHLFLSGSKFKKFIKVGSLFSIIFILVIFGLPLINEYLSLKGVEGLERHGFVESVIKKIDSNSIIYKIYSLPIYLKYPIGFVFFLLLPFFSPNFFFDGMLNLRGIFFTSIMPIISVIYFKYFVSGLLFTINNNKKFIKRIFYIFFFSILLISQASIQPRHKTTIMPIFYILVAYGISHNNNKVTNKIGGVFAFFLMAVQFIMLII